MTKEELDEEIEFVHSHNTITNKRLLRPLKVIQKVITEATNTYTNLLSFMIDYESLYADNLIDDNIYASAMNDLYLLALLHTSYDETLANNIKRLEELEKENKKLKQLVEELKDDK